MKNFFRILLAVGLAVAAYAKPTIEFWNEGESSRTHEKQISFAIIDGGGLNDLRVKGLNTRKWTYLLTLKGERRTRYEKDLIRLTSPDSQKPKAKPAPQIESGHVDVDFERGIATILLKVKIEDHIQDFEGNATYPIPKQAPKRGAGGS